MSDVMKRLESIEFIEKAGKDGALLTMKDINWLGNTIKQQQERIEKYEKALKFYADKKSWTEPTKEVIVGEWGPDVHNGPPAIIEDSGSLASQALDDEPEEGRAYESGDDYDN